ncbi:MAG: NUDIX domain-containing protein [Planctomycetes bacterium]|nr:NUDIX domain-containing protein [Planctomycetota bacterium]
MEFVFVAPREALFPSCYPQGFHPFRTGAEASEMLERLGQHGFFVQRERAERTPAWKQPIPYCVVASEEGILLMKRRAKGGEARLFDKLTIGVGGHINPIDHADGAELVRNAARREMSEELVLLGEPELRLAGFLNDDSNPVGAVHLGLVFAAIATGSVRIREEDVLEGRMVESEELRASLARGDNFETWSATLIAHLDELALVRHPATT